MTHRDLISSEVEAEEIEELEPWCYGRGQIHREGRGRNEGFE